MASITVTKDQTGQIVGFGEKDKKAYGRFKQKVKDLQPGELYTIEAWFPRNPRLHGLHFAMLAQVFDAQEQFSDPEQLRLWLQVGAGHCEFVPGPTGRMVAIPKSISFRSMDDAEFSEHHERVKAFLRSDHAQAFLWPHLPADQRAEMVEGVLQGFETTA